MKACKKDTNHGVIVLTLSCMGLCWHDTHDQGGRALDGIAFNPISMRMRFVEIKTPKGQLTPKESLFMSMHPGQCVVLRTADDCRALRRIL